MREGKNDVLIAVNFSLRVLLVHLQSCKNQIVNRWCGAKDPYI